MIVFDLKCSAGGHIFEIWFASSADFDSQRERGLVLCPYCGDPDVDKAVMAPRIAAKGNRAPAAVDAPQMVASAPDEAKEMLRALALMQRKLLENSDYVGDRFADEARSIHIGDTPPRSIYGKATKAQTESLIEDGIAVAPLPLPVVPPGEEN